MTTTPNTYLYWAPQDLYRFGNSASPRLDHMRSNDVDLYQENSVLHVRANGKGISLLTEKGAMGKPGWLWRIPQNTPLPDGLVLHHDRPDHFSLCPDFDMTVEEYLERLRQLALCCQKVRKQ